MPGQKQEKAQQGQEASLPIAEQVGGHTLRLVTNTRAEDRPAFGFPHEDEPIDDLNAVDREQQMERYYGTQDHMGG
jgi:hypothetical protein